MVNPPKTPPPGCFSERQIEAAILAWVDPSGWRCRAKRPPLTGCQPPLADRSV